MSKVFRSIWIAIACLAAPAVFAGPDQPTTAPAGVIGKEAREFWCFKPVADPVVPSVKDAGWCRNEIDRFVLAKLEERGLRPAPAASKVELVRRVYFDLTGLPPTPQQVKAFVEDASDRAGMTLSDWMRAVLARAANEGAFAPRKVGKKRERTTTS